MERFWIRIQHRMSFSVFSRKCLSWSWAWSLSCRRTHHQWQLSCKSNRNSPSDCQEPYYPCAPNPSLYSCCLSSIGLSIATFSSYFLSYRLFCSDWSFNPCESLDSRCPSAKYQCSKWETSSKWRDLCTRRDSHSCSLSSCLSSISSLVESKHSSYHPNHRHPCQHCHYLANYHYRTPYPEYC